MFFNHQGAFPEVGLLNRSSQFPSSENKLFSALPVDGTQWSAELCRRRFSASDARTFQCT